MIEQNSSPSHGELAGFQFAAPEVISARNCGRREFIERFVEPGVPCIIEDLTHDWPAFKKWTRDFFVHEQGHSPIYYHHLYPEDGGQNYERGPSKTTIANLIARLERGELIRHASFSHALYDFIDGHPSLIHDIRLQSIADLVAPIVSWASTLSIPDSIRGCHPMVRKCSSAARGPEATATTIPTIATPSIGACGAARA